MVFILDLCGGSRAWSEPYRAAGYCVEVIDPLHDTGDVRLFQRLNLGLRGILAAPPCTKFALSGNGTRGREMDAGTYEDGIRDALSVVDACIRIAWVQQPVWWSLENPLGTLARYLGPPRMMFDPADYGDPYTKRTCLWGQFNCPPKRRVQATQGSKLHRLPPSPDRWRLRSVTPPGFARAFFEVNP